MTTQDQNCDPITGACALPPPNEKTQPRIPSKNLSTLDVLRTANVTTLINDNGHSVPIDSLPPTPLILLYCSASWCPPCRSFTPKLSAFLAKQKSLHCILVSCDRTPETYLDYLTKHCHGMYAIPYSPESGRQQIMSSLGVNGIPSLIVMDSSGKVITTSGRGAVEGNAENCVEEWLNGKPGTNWISGINWLSVVLYSFLFLVWWWYSRSK